MNLYKSKISKWLWGVTAAGFVAYAGWRLAALFYGELSFQMSKFILAVPAFCGVLQFLLTKRKGKGLTKWEVASILLIVTIGFSVIMQILFLPDRFDMQGRSAHAYLVTVSVYNVCWLLAGYALQSIGVVRRSNWVTFTLLGGIVIVVINALHGGWVVDYSKFDANVGSGGDSYANHLVIGDSVYLLLIAAYALSSGWVRVLTFFVSMPVLFALGGRADLAIYTISTVGLEWFSGVRRSKFFHITMILALCAAIAACLPTTVLDKAGVSRMFFANGVGHDASYEQRELFFQTGVANLFEQAPVGDVSHLVIVNGSLGSYIHNLLSVWQYNGVLVFGMVALLLILNLRRLFRLARYSNDALGSFGVLIFLSSFIGVIIAKALVYPELWVTLGYFAGGLPSDVWSVRAPVVTPTAHS